VAEVRPRMAVDALSMRTIAAHHHSEPPPGVGHARGWRSETDVNVRARGRRGEGGHLQGAKHGHTMGHKAAKPVNSLHV
jgi:hypothetical protein